MTWLAPLSLLGVWLLGSAIGFPADAAEIRVLSSSSLREVLQDLAPKFERSTGHTLAITFDSSGGIKRAIDAGAAFDLAVAGPAQIEDLVRTGKVAKDTKVVIARTGIGVAIRAGAPKPDISSTEAFKRTLLNAKSIMFNKEGASGIYVASLLERLGLADQLRDKIKLKLVSGPIAEDVVRGEAEIGLQLISEILPVHGAELLGPLPPELQNYIALTAGISSTAKEASAAGEFIAFLAQPASVDIMSARGLEPIPR